MKELAYAFDTLHADGVGLMSHYGEAGYIGEPAFAPVFEEMNRRRLVAFIHPRSPYWDRTGDAAERQNIRLPGMGATELPFDTTRAVMNMLAHGTTEKYPNIRFILAHSGGTAPFLVQRATVLSGSSAKTPYTQTWDKLAKAMSTFYYDVTNASARPNMKAVLELASASKLVFGTDVPYGGNGQFIRELLADLPRNGLSEAEAAGVRYGNAEVLFPRFKQQS
jgi:predicted TIM-barrel fold metal-dependent hydrolase